MNPQLLAVILKVFGPFDGKKTYIGGALIGAAAFLRVVSPDHTGLADLLQTLGMALVGVGIAHKIEKLSEGQPPVEPPLPTA